MVANVCHPYLSGNAETAFMQYMLLPNVELNSKLFPKQTIMCANFERKTLYVTNS